MGFLLTHTIYCDLTTVMRVNECSEELGEKQQLVRLLSNGKLLKSYEMETGLLVWRKNNLGFQVYQVYPQNVLFLFLWDLLSFLRPE